MDNKKIFLIVFSLILGLGLNNLTRNLNTIIGGLTFFMSLVGISFVIATLIYSTQLKRNKELYKQAFNFILSGMLILFALALVGFVIKPENNFFLYWSLNSFTFLEIILTWILSIANYLGLSLFFYASLNLLLSLRKGKNL